MDRRAPYCGVFDLVKLGLFVQDLAGELFYLLDEAFEQ